MSDPNSRSALVQRYESGKLGWRGPALVLFARSGFAVLAHAGVAAALSWRGSSDPWHDAERWLPLYGTAIDAGCVALLWWFTRREGIATTDLVGFKRSNVLRDVLLGLVLIPACLVFIYAGTFIAGLVVYGRAAPPYFLGGLPVLATLYGVLIWPVIWGLVEQTTYNGYLLPRFQVLCRSTIAAVAIVAFVWSLQHAFMPLTFDTKFMSYRLIASVPSSVFNTVVYLRLHRVVPLAVSHALMDSATVLIPALSA